MYGVKIKFKFYTQLFQEQLRMQFKREKCKCTLSINATPKNIHTWNSVEDEVPFAAVSA